MTSKETYSSGSEPTRRDVLRSVGSIGVLSSIGNIATESVGSLIPLNIGYHDDSGHEAAANLADSVVRNFDFNAATITIPEQLLSGSAVETLADDDSIRYVEPDRTMAAFGQSVPWGSAALEQQKPTIRISVAAVSILRFSTLESIVPILIFGGILGKERHFLTVLDCYPQNKNKLIRAV
ncbi:hypothetical protein ACFQL7_03295 [Halocatena marina]|uniref:Uncharacterized protein n=1 Tax=Halocatena marina TaxID=2934937 RepID=A0ABD5YMZ8_9EURY